MGDIIIGSDIKNKLIEEFENLKGQHILIHGKVWRLIAVTSGYDYYYVLWDGRKFSWASVLSRITPLKGYIIQEHYDFDYVKMAKLNDFDQVFPDGIERANSAFVSDVSRTWDTGFGYEQYEIIAGPCWDLN